STSTPKKAQSSPALTTGSWPDAHGPDQDHTPSLQDCASMTDTTGATPRASFKLPKASLILDTLRSGDIALATGVMGLIVILILPMPPLLLDALLAISIVFSVMILMTALFIQKPLEFSSFPTVLLIATMLRLGLNLATTRLILSEGHTGTDA